MGKHKHDALMLAQASVTANPKVQMEQACVEPCGRLMDAIRLDNVFGQPKPSNCGQKFGVGYRPAPYNVLRKTTI